jgi:hypothetical protein
MTYDPYNKTAEELELEQTLRQLVDRLDVAREGSAEQRRVLRMMDGIRHGSELGGLLMEEYDIGKPPW